jgi:alpha-beta hydrolase superfamily lysophospholipase
MIVVRWIAAWVIDHVVAAGWQWNSLRDPEIPGRYAEGDREPVLLLAGVYETWQFLRPIADRLNRHGHPVYLLPEIGYNRAPIVPTAALVERFIIARDLRGIVVIGHSKGGLIGKQLMLTDAVADRIDRMVAINSPFSGSRFARMAPGATLRAFSPKDTTLRMLADNLEANARITSIYSTLDPIIPEGSRLDGATNIELPVSGHFRPLGQRVLLEAVDCAVDGQRARE